MATGEPKVGRRFAGYKTNSVSQFTYILFLYFICDFFLRFSVRLPGYGVIRPTLLAVASISLLLFLQRDKLKDRFNDPIFRIIFVLLSYIVVSLPFVEWPGSVLRLNIDTFIRSVVFLFFTALIVDTEKRLVWFVSVFVFCQVFRVLEPLFLNITQGYWGSATHLSGGDFANRLAGAPADVINPNELGFVIATVIPFLHYLLFPRGWLCKLLYLLIMPALLYALILTMSRGGFIALLVVAFMVFKESRYKFRLAALAVVVVVAAFNVMTPIQKDRYLSLIDRDTAGGASAEGRLRGMVREFELGLTRPIVGHGLGTTPEAKTHKLGSRQASHNLYAELLIELGVIGFVIFLIFLARSAKQLLIMRESIGKIKDDRLIFYQRLNKVMVCLFWMYAVYSINYWGLSQYYWYLFGGMTIALTRLASSAINKRDCDAIDIVDDSEVAEANRFVLAKRLRYRKH